jgi:hypothetical protein
VSGATLTHPQRAALTLEAFKPGQVHPRVVDHLIKRGRT